MLSNFTIGVLLFSVVLLVSLRRRHTATFVPPGPPGLFLVGNVFQVPKSQPWLYFASLTKTYGPIIRLSIGRKNILVLNKGSDAEELLGERSANNSTRPYLLFASKYISNFKRLVLLPYNEEFKKQRTAYYQMLHPSKMSSYEALVLDMSWRLLHDMLYAPGDASLNASRFTSSIMYLLSYGKYKEEGNDDDLKTSLRLIDTFTKHSYPGAHLVDTFEWLDSEWIPDKLASWRRAGRQMHDAEANFYIKELRQVESKMMEGREHPGSFAARVLEDRHSLGLDEESLAYLIASSINGGTASTTGSIMFFILAMVLYPETLRRAQDEIDSVVGSGGNCAPSFEHLRNLPYCVALCKEVMRWNPAAPGCFPHMSEKTDIWRGYTIKGGTTIIPNVWAMHRDETTFRDAHVFDPTRYLNKDDNGEPTVMSLTEGHWGFGFGRRVCPGKTLAVRVVFVAFTRLAWAFDIKYATDKNGVPIPVDPTNVKRGFNAEPNPFPLRVRPRSRNHKDFIEKQWDDAKSRLKQL